MVTPASSDASAPARAARGRTTWHAQLALLFGAAMAALAVALVAVAPPVMPDGQGLGAAALTLALFVVGGLLVDRLENGSWTGYPHVAAQLAWLTLGLPLALILLLLSAVLVLIGELAFPSTLRLPRFSPMERISLTAARIAITGAGLIVASTLHAALDGAVSPAAMTLTGLVELALALVAGTVVSNLVGALLFGESHDLLARVARLVQPARAFQELVYVAAIIVLSLLHGAVAPALYAAALALVAAQALRLRHAARADAELRDRVEELSLLNRSSELLGSTLVMDDLLMAVYRQVQAISDAPVIYVALHDREHATVEYRLAMVNGQRASWPRRTVENSAAGRVIQSQAMIHADRRRDDPLASVTLSSVEQEHPVFLGLPLTIGPETLGALVVLDTGERGTFDDFAVRVLQMIAQQAALAIHNAAMYSNSTTLAEHLSLIAGSTQSVMLKLDKGEVVRRLCETAQAVAQAGAAALFLYNRAQRSLTLVHAVNLQPGQLQFYASSQTGEPPASIRLLADSRESPDSALVREAEQGGFRALAQVPLVLNNAPLGCLTLYYREPHYHSRTEIELLQMLASQVASALGNAELFGALEVYAQEMAHLAHLSRVSTSNLDLTTVAQDVAAILCQILGVNRATVALLNPNGPRWDVVGNHVTLDRPPLQTPEEALVTFPELADLVTEERPGLRVLMLDGTISEGLRRLLVANREQTLALVPMLINNGLIGVLLLASLNRRPFTEREAQLVEMAGNQIGAQLQNARLFTTTHLALKQRLDQLAVIEDIARQISGTLDFNQIIRNMLEAALRSAQASYAALALLTDEYSQRLIVVDYTNGSFSRSIAPLPRDESVLGRVVRSGKPVLVRDTRAEPHYMAPRTGTTYLSALATPLLRDDGVIGILSVESETTNAFTEEHASFLSNLAGHAVISIGNARMLEERQYQVKALASLQALALRLSSTVDSRSVATTVLETAATIFEPAEASVFRFNARTQSFSLLASLRLHEGTYHAAPGLIAPELAQEAVQKGEIRVVQRDRIDPARRATTRLAYASVITVPLKHGNTVHEVLALAFSEPRHFPRRDMDALALLASQAAGHLENAMLHEQIRAGNERMTAILTTTRDGVILLDPRGWVVESNPAARRLLGDNLNAYVESAIAGASWRQTDASRRETGMLRTYLGQVEAVVTRRQFDLKTAAGTVYVEEIGSPVVDAQNRPVGWLLVLRDITEERQLAEYRDEITHMVVHDLRGPLASIISGVELAQEEVAARPEFELAGKMLSLSSDSANRLMVLVESLLDIARMEAREMPLKLEVTPVERIVDRAVHALESTIQQSEIQLRMALPPAAEPLCVDVEIATRVLINLLDNAVRHTPTGAVILIAAEPAGDGKTLLLRVADSGRGIPADEREHVFEKFTQARGAVAARAARRGTGLGLTFCRLAVEAHGGRIWVEERGPLSGASFAFTLPVALEQGAALPAP